MSIMVLDPTAESEGPAAALAPALDSLAGRTVGLLDNSKYNVTRFLDHVEEILRTQYGVREVVRARKRDASRPAPEEVMQSLAGCDAILPAVGD
jgi:hypothetical protein